MARESKGQQVKSFKDTIPQPDQSSISEVTKVYFKADNGKFRIFLPEHIAALIKSGVDLLEAGGEYHGEARVEGPVIDEVIEAWENVKEKYLALLRTEGAVKVIRYSFRAQPRPSFTNDPWDFGHSANLGAGVAMLLHYEVLWRSGNRLYYGHYEDNRLVLQDKGPVPSKAASWERDRLIEWTEEREAFFASATVGMKRLIEQIIDFIGDGVEDNIAALAAGTRTLAITSKV